MQKFYANYTLPNTIKVNKQKEFQYISSRAVAATSYGYAVDYEILT